MDDLVKPRRVELVALVLLGITVLMTVAGPFYYNSMVRSETGNERVFYVTAKQWAFEPNHFVVKKGETVTFILTSADVTHGFQILAYNVSVVLHPGDYVKVSFVANKVGTFEIRCFVYCGEPVFNSGAGHWLMSGLLTVVEA